MKLRQLQPRKQLFSYPSSLWPHHWPWGGLGGSHLRGQLHAPLIALALAALVSALPAAPTNSAAAKPGPPKSETTAPAVRPPPPQSVFVIPKTPTEGKDPFFPTATRVYNSDPEVKPKGPVVSVGELSLKGISGTPGEPLAIINTTTFTTGEENEVITTTGRLRVRCVEINMVLGTVLVQVGGERRELRLRPKK